jgi:uncharacterized membrane-anchored protein
VRKAIAILAGLVILAAANWTIAGRERLLTDGRVVLLELAPVDPRSLMQGDYMMLRFRAADEALGRSPAKALADGRVVARVDERGVARGTRPDDGAPLAADEVVLRYRVRDGRVKFATNAFFFEEGRAREHAGARYGEFRVSRSGDMILTSLRDAELRRLGGSGS